MRLGILLSCTSFEGFYGRVQKQTRQTYLESYRNDWAWYYARAFLEYGIEPTIYIPSYYEAGLYATPDGIAVRFLPLSLWYRPLEHVRLKQASRQTRWSLYLDEWLNTLAFMKPLHHGLITDRIDHLYIQEYWSGRFDYLACHLAIPVSGANHGGISQGVLQWFKRSAFASAAICYAQTRQECALIEHYGGRAQFQPNGCDITTFYPNTSVPRRKTVLTVARLTNKQKRTSDLVRAVALLPTEWSLDIVGTGPDRAKLESLVRRLGLADRVRFRGFLSRTELRDLFWRCGVFSMPSQNEAVALAALEAMGCGAPVVLSRIPAFMQLVQDGVNGRTVPVGDVKALKAAILDAWDRRDTFGMKAVETIRQDYDKRILYRVLADTLRASTTGSTSQVPSSAS